MYYSKHFCHVEVFRTRDKRVTEIDYQLKYAIFSTACSIVYNCVQTRPISKHLYSGIFMDPIRNTKSSKKTEFINVMFHV